MGQHPGTDQRLLREEAYPDSANLGARSSIYAYKTPTLDFWEWALRHADWPAGLRVLDIGCGPGQYLQRLRQRERSLHLVGIDLSEGMVVEAADTGASMSVGSVQAIPLATASVDRVLAMHMLYHAPDILVAVAELRRVLRPGGVLLAVTNGGDHLQGTIDLIRQAAGIEHMVRFMERFTLEDGGRDLATAFDDVSVEAVAGELIVPHVGPVMAYIESMRALAEGQLPAGVGWDEVLVDVRRAVEAKIASDGAWRCPTHSGVFICR
jgi:SAM-dependent methyltransferase